MSRRLLLQMVKHEWMTLLRRNLAGFVAGLFPTLFALVFGMMAVSMVVSFDELRQYGPVPSESQVVLGGVAVLSFFSIMYAVFLASDVIVIERELGTIELIFSAPIRHLELLLGKALVPFLFNLVVGGTNLILFSAAYVMGGSMYGRTMMSPWPITALAFLLLVLTLGLAVCVGVWVSSFSASTKAAATISLGVGSLLALAVIGLGVVLSIQGRSPEIVILVVGCLTLILWGGSGTAVLAIFRDHERYFLHGERGAKG